MSCLSIVDDDVATLPRPSREWSRPLTLAARNVGLAAMLALMLAFFAFFGAAAFLP